MNTIIMPDYFVEFLSPFDQFPLVTHLVLEPTNPSDGGGELRHGFCSKSPLGMMA